MGIRKYKPTTPGRRGASVADFNEITRDHLGKPLLRPLHKTEERDNLRRVTSRRYGGGYKRQYRLIDFRRHGKDGIPAKMAHIEYDPNRTTRIALLHYAGGEKRYILAPEKLKQGNLIEQRPGVNIKLGNCLSLKNISLDTTVHTVEMCPGGGAKIARSAGVSVQLVVKEGKMAQLRMPSREIHNVDTRYRATIGEVGNADHGNIDLGKAGRSRWLGRRPKVHGVVVNPVDHPHGGGEGRTSGGRHPVNPRGKPEGRTRGKKKASNQYIVRRRKTGKKRRQGSSNMLRSLKKGPFVDDHPQREVDMQNKANTKNVIKTWSCRSMITPDFLGHIIAVHDGRKHVSVFIIEAMVGHKLGEFAPIRTYRGHAKGDKKGRR